MHKSAPEYCTYIMVLLLGGLYAPVSLHAQSYLYGYVRDMSSLPVENANVIFTSESNEMISFAATTDSQGKYEVKAPISVRDEKPGQFILLQNYPNPFNPATVIPLHSIVPRILRLPYTISWAKGQASARWPHGCRVSYGDMECNRRQRQPCRIGSLFLSFTM